jgi:hypothetical protein
VRGWFWIQQLIEFQQAPAVWATAEGGFGAVVACEFGSVTESGARARTVVTRAPVEQPPIKAESMTGNQRARARLGNSMDFRIEPQRIAGLV